MSTKENNNEEQQEEQNIPWWKPAIGYLFSLIVLVVSVVYGKSVVDRGTPKEGFEIMFTGMFIMFAGILIAITIAFIVFVKTRKKNKKE